MRIDWLAVATAVTLFLASCAQADDAPKPKRMRVLPENWVTVGTAKALSSSEDVRLLRFPSAVGPDTTCILYRNLDFHTAQIICPGEAPDFVGFELPQGD